MLQFLRAVLRGFTIFLDIHFLLIMRQIQLYEYEPPRYRVYDPKGIYYIAYTGNGLVHKFGSKQECLRFLAESSRFVSLKMHEVNFYLTLFYADYRKIWPYLYDIKADNEALSAIDSALLHNLNDIPLFLKQLQREKRDGDMYHRFVWRTLDRCFECLLPCADCFIDFYRRRSMGVEIHNYTIHLEALRRSRADLADYGKNRENAINQSEAIQAHYKQMRLS